MRVKSGALSNPATIPMAKILPYHGTRGGRGRRPGAGGGAGRAAPAAPGAGRSGVAGAPVVLGGAVRGALAQGAHPLRHRVGHPEQDRKSTRLNSSHVKISYAVF